MIRINLCGFKVDKYGCFQLFIIELNKNNNGLKLQLMALHLCKSMAGTIKEIGIFHLHKMEHL